MHMISAKKSTKDLYLEYARKLNHQIGTLSLDPDLLEEDFCEMLRNAIETGIPINEDDVCMPSLPKGYVF